MDQPPSKRAGRRFESCRGYRAMRRPLGAPWPGSGGDGDGAGLPRSASAQEYFSTRVLCTLPLWSWPTARQNSALPLAAQLTPGSKSYGLVGFTVGTMLHVVPFHRSLRVLSMSMDSS